MQLMDYSKSQFVAFRASLALFMFYQFMSLFYYRQELFSFDGSGAVLITGGLSALCFGAGFWRRSTALIIWILLVYLVWKNEVIHDFDLEYSGWLLLANLFISRRMDAGSSSSPQTPSDVIEMPKILYRGAWLILALGYSLSGFSKWGSLQWVSGNAIELILGGPTSRLSFPGPFQPWVSHLLQICTWSVLITETLFLPLALFQKTRFWIFTAMSTIHVAIGSLTVLTELSVSALIFHIFVFDARWVPKQVFGKKEPSTKSAVSTQNR